MRKSGRNSRSVAFPSHASCSVGFGGKMGVDATAKWKEEGYARGWPVPVAMAPDIEARVDRLWPELNITAVQK